MANLEWYWHRLRAMGARELALHARDRIRHFEDARIAWPPDRVDLGRCGAFPNPAPREAAPPDLRDALRGDVSKILAGRWAAFGDLELCVGDPPNWHCDSRSGEPLASAPAAFRLDRRRPPPGVDLKIVWEPSRWYSLTRLAMAAYVLDNERAALKCIEWLENWVEKNPPYRGWNWTSTLEVGVRLSQFTWIDALLEAWKAREPTANRLQATELERRLHDLRRTVLPPHTWYAWRHRSFGSSANNHLIGELTGLILASSRWPGLARWCVPLEMLQARWEHEVLTQFSLDGGNREQALGYHFSAWEHCCETRLALQSAGRAVSAPVEERLKRAAQFFLQLQVPSDPWDHGDSDGAVGTPLAADTSQPLREWHRWIGDPGRSQAIGFWIGENLSPPASQGAASKGWARFEASGHAVRHADGWTLRWDLSPLGLGSTAAHAHLDALHVSMWRSGVALVVDPGTGTYADEAIRNWLSSAEAHNVIVPIAGKKSAWPRRLGPFLWERFPGRPRWNGDSSPASLDLHDRWRVSRSVEVEAGGGCVVTDLALHDGEVGAFRVRWQLAPGSRMEELGERHFLIERQGVRVQVRVGPEWARAHCVTSPNQVAAVEPGAPLAGIVSPAFETTVWAPYILLEAHPRPDTRSGFTTAFSSG